MGDRKYTFLFNGEGWFLQIANLQTLNEYHSMIWDIRKNNFIEDLRREREGKHPTSDIAGLCQTLGRLRGRDSFAEFQRLEATQHKQMSHMIIEGETLYANPVGGYTVRLDNIQNRYETDEIKWPVFREEDIFIKQWPGGTHYYAYIGPVQVIDGDVRKWESESDARMAAKAYVSTKKKLK